MATPRPGDLSLLPQSQLPDALPTSTMGCGLHRTSPHSAQARAAGGMLVGVGTLHPAEPECGERLLSGLGWGEAVVRSGVDQGGAATAHSQLPDTPGGWPTPRCPSGEEGLGPRICPRPKSTHQGTPPTPLSPPCPCQWAAGKAWSCYPWVPAPVPGLGSHTHTPECAQRRTYVPRSSTSPPRSPPPATGPLQVPQAGRDSQ